MAERFVIRDLKSGEYLAEKFMRGIYFTNDISQAVKCKTKEDAQKKADAQTLRPIAALTVDSVNFA